MNCRLCQSFETVEFFLASNVHGRHLWDEGDRFVVKRCLRCEVVYIDGLNVNDDYYRKYYPSNYYEGDKVSGFLKSVLDLVSRVSFKTKEKLILQSLRRRPGEKIRILDIGCGQGDFLNILDPERFEKFGIEINPQGYETCSKKHIHIYNQDIKTIDFKDEFFDAVTLWHVVEHLQNPSETLRMISRILKKDGVLVIGTPCIDNLGFRWGKSLWFHLDAPRHLILFGKRSAKFLLEKSGFEAIARASTFYDYPLDLFWSLRNSFRKFFVYPLYPLFKWISPETMILICRKR